ncbi:MAG TPA: hypothetical protein VF510_25895 [Ktedonobacterales bacterium]
MVGIDERSIAGYFEMDECNGMGRRGAYVWRAAAFVFVMLCFGLPLYGVWEGMQTHNWQELRSDAQFPLYAMAFLPWAIGMGWFPWRTVSTAVSRVWRAVAERDNTLAPLAETQPEPLSGDEQLGAVEVLASLRGIKDGMRVGIYWCAVTIVLLLAVLFAFTAMLLGSSAASSSALPRPGLLLMYGIVLVLGLLALALLSIGVLMAVWARQLRRGLSVTADETGLTWRDTRWRSGERRIVWSEAEAFITIMCRGSGEPPTRVYALKAGGTTLLWSVKAFMSRQEYAASERLLRLAVTRTQLQLRDLTAISRAAVDELIRVSPRRGTRPAVVVAQSSDTSALLDAVLPHDFIAEAARKARRVLMLSVYAGLPYTVVLIMSTVVPWFWGGH